MLLSRPRFVRGGDVGGREMDVRKTCRNMGIPNAMGTTKPAARIDLRSGGFVLVEAGEINAPDIAIFRRQRSVVRLRQPFHSVPGKSKLDRPALIRVALVIERAIDVHGRL